MKTYQINSKSLALILGMSFIVVGFQNCSDAVFSTRGLKLNDSVTQGEPTDPNDPDCNCHNEPVSNTATAVFEDLYMGDDDYNDFVVTYNVKETSNQFGIQRIDIEFQPRAKLAAYDHRLLINLVGHRTTDANLPDNKDTLPALEDDCATAVLKTYSSTGTLISVKDVDPYADITVFESTHGLFGESQIANQKSVLTVYMADASKTHTRQIVDLDRYRLMLKVKDTSRLLELVDINNNQVDSAGFPFGIRIPDMSFDYPEEGQFIEDKFPLFADYRQYLADKRADPNAVASDDVMNWFVTFVSTNMAMAN